MYDEFERAMTGRTPRRGMGLLGWALTTVGLLFMVGMVGVAFAVKRATHEVGEFARDFEFNGGLAGLAALADVEAQTRLLSLDLEQGLDFLDGLGSGDPADAFTEEMVRGTFDLARVERRARREARVREVGQPSTPALDGDVHVDLDRSDEGASLVINAGGEALRFDVARTASGGYLSIDSEDGNVRFDLEKQGDGGQLLISSEDGTVRLGVGDGADGMPGWVPTFGMPERPRPVYSLDSAEGFLGAVTWEADAAPSDILAFYKQELEAQGYELRDRYRRSGAEIDEGSFWARNEADGRMVFVVAHQESAGTQVLLGYGESR